MDLSNWINLGLLVATLFSGFMAAVAARHAARQSRTSASDARDSAEAGRRSAAALEEANELRRDALRKPRWSVAKVPERPAAPSNSGHRFLMATMMATDQWVLTNNGPGRVTNVRVELRGPDLSDDYAGWSTKTFPAEAIDEGLGGTVNVSRAMFHRGDQVLDVTWCDSDGSEKQFAVMLC